MGASFRVAQPTQSPRRAIASDGLAPALLFVPFVSEKDPAGWVDVAFKGDEPLGAFKDITTRLAEPANEEGAPVGIAELKALLADPRTKEIYRTELEKYASPRSVKI